MLFKEHFFIVEGIRDGRLKPADRLPPERELAQTWKEVFFPVLNSQEATEADE